MKLQDFDFRIWNTACKKYIDDVGLISNIMCDLIHSATDIIEDFEIELWTGYLDKNGKKIYEGDILENKMTMEDLPYKVVFKWGAFYLVEIDGNDEDLMSEFLFMELEVIGNIHENAELLKC
ncbi:TPA: hypothetical protein SB542_000935 [Campylobacter jejuni]|nr:hypothetical protein [Campylobacter jejuni]